MNSFQIWDTAWYAQGFMFLVWVIVIVGVSIGVAFIASYPAAKKGETGKETAIAGITVFLTVGIFAFTVIFNVNNHLSERNSYYEDTVRELNAHYDVTLLEPRESPDSVPNEVDARNTLEELERDGYEPVSIFTDNTLLNDTAYIHRNDDNELSLVVEDSSEDAEETLVEYDGS